ncbi:MAG: hypothetical protein AAGF93_01465 [Cyanobacteria bacterium P01_H01_bin.105]
MSEKNTAEECALDLQVLKRMAFSRTGFMLKNPGGKLITDYPDMVAEEVIKHHFKTGNEGRTQQEALTICVNKTKSALKRDIENRKNRDEIDPSWRERFQIYLNKESVRLGPDTGTYKAIDNYPNAAAYMIDCLKFVRCAAAFMRQDLDAQAQQARDNQIKYEAQQQLLEELEAQGCLASYLQCMLPER